MKIIKKSFQSVPREEAHGGSGARRLYATEKEMENPHFSAMTHGYLPAKGIFDWHQHDGIEEMMLVLKGSGTVQDRDGTYSYASGDFFIFPQNTEHRIENQDSAENEFIFVRFHVKKPE